MDLQWADDVVAANPPDSLRHQRLTDDELCTVKRLHDAVTGPATAEVYRDFIDNVVAPKCVREDVIYGRLHESTPIYDAVVVDFGYDPLVAVRVDFCPQVINTVDAAPCRTGGK